MCGISRLMQLEWDLGVGEKRRSMGLLLQDLDSKIPIACMKGSEAGLSQPGSSEEPEPAGSRPDHGPPVTAAFAALSWLWSPHWQQALQVPWSGRKTFEVTSPSQPRGIVLDGLKWHCWCTRRMPQSVWTSLLLCLSRAHCPRVLTTTLRHLMDPHIIGPGCISSCLHRT